MIYLLIIIGIHIFLFLKLIYFPSPEFFIYPYLTNRGFLPYKQILDQHFPGLMFFPINFDSLGMKSPDQAKLVSVIIIILTQVLLFFVAEKILKSKKKALLANILYLIWQPFFEGWVLWIDSFLPLFLLPAFYFSYEARQKGQTRSLFLSGLFLGMAVIFKQVILPLVFLVGLFLYLERKKLKEVLWFLAGFIPLPLIMIFYFWSKGIWPDFWYWTVIYNLTVFARFGKKAPLFSHFVRVAAVYGFSVIGFFNKKSRNVFGWLMIFMFGSLAAALARFDFVHFQPSLPFVVLASVISLVWAYEKSQRRVLVFVYGLGMIFLFLTFLRGHLGNKIFFFDKETLSISQKIQEGVSPGESIFIYGSIPHLYQLSQTLPAGHVFVFQFPWFMMVAEDRILKGIREDNPRLVVADRTVEIEGNKLTDFTPKINSFLLENYETFDRIGNVEFLKPKQK